MSNHQHPDSAPNEDSLLKSESPKLDDSLPKSELSSSKGKLQSEASKDLSSHPKNQELIHHIGKNAWEIKDGDKSYLLGGVEMKVRRKADRNKTNNQNHTSLDEELQKQAREHLHNQTGK